MRARRIAALTLALCAALEAAAQPGIELTPAWGGWSRPGRTTEVELRVRADAPTRGTLELVAGPERLRTELGLEAGETLRLHLPLRSAPAVEARLELAGHPPERRELALALSESPLFGVALETGAADLDGFHAVALVPADLPHEAAGYGPVDALLLDAATLRALDQRQLGALLGHVAACGRVALVGPEPGVQRVLEGAAGCGGRLLVSAPQLDAALSALQATLAAPAAAAVAPRDVAELLPPDLATWRRVAALLAVGIAAATLAVVATAAPLLLAAVPVAASALLALLLLAAPPRERLVVWAEAEPGARAAQYHAWQRVAGGTRGAVQVRVPAGLGPPRACEPGRPVRFDVDARLGRPLAASFDARLFETVTLCYSGSFPVLRALGVRPLAGDRFEVHNEGALAWPPAVLVSAGRVYPLPGLEAGAVVTLSTDAGRAPRDAAQRAALSRTPFGGHAGLWRLELASVASAPADASAWLLVPVAGGP